MKAPIDHIKHFLDTQRNIDDLRLHALLWFNAFEQIMKSMLAWRLGCSVESIPTMSSSFLFRLVLVDHYGDLWEKKASKFNAARNTIAHRFHEAGHDKQLIDFCEKINDEKWPRDKNSQLVFLADAVRILSIEIASAISGTPERGEFPFPQLLYEMK